MGSIPLPALDINPPQPFDYLGQLGKVTALKTMLQQQQYQQQIQPLELQQKQLELKVAQRQMDSSNAFMQAMVNKPSSDVDDITKEEVMQNDDTRTMREHLKHMFVKRRISEVVE